MTETLCELRFDIPLPPGSNANRFEKAWRAQLAAQKMTALAMPPAQAVAARFRICGPDGQAEMKRYLTARLAALPGSPSVICEMPALSQDWAGVKVWLSYRSQDLPALLQKTRQPSKKTFPRQRPH